MFWRADVRRGWPPQECCMRAACLCCCGGVVGGKVSITTSLAIIRKQQPDWSERSRPLWPCHATLERATGRATCVRPMTCSDYASARPLELAGSRQDARALPGSVGATDDPGERIRARFSGCPTLVLLCNERAARYMTTPPQGISQSIPTILSSVAGTQGQTVVGQR